MTPTEKPGCKCKIIDITSTITPHRPVTHAILRCDWCKDLEDANERAKEQLAEIFRWYHSAELEGFKKNTDIGALQDDNTRLKAELYEALHNPVIREMKMTEQQLQADKTRLEAEIANAAGYLTRLIQSVSPGIEPLPSLLGLCTQVDNLLAGRHKLQAEKLRLEQQVKWFISIAHEMHTEAEPCGQCDGLLAKFENLIRNAGLRG